jgi:very-short-patch-repair endonuclease
VFRPNGHATDPSGVLSHQARRARQLRNDLSKAEWKVWSRLQNRQVAGFKFRRQYPIGPFFADFACVAARLVVEVDGDEHDPDYDARRDKFISARGFRVVRIPVAEVDDSLDDVVETIFHALMDGGDT